MNASTLFVPNRPVLRFALAGALLALACPGALSTGSGAPVVSNLVAEQRDGTQLVDIAYDLASDFEELHVTLGISSDGGETWTVPSTSVSGDVGPGVSPGAGKAIVWDAGADWPGHFSEQIRFRVLADDGYEPPDPAFFSLVPAGPFTMGRTSGDTEPNAPPVTVTVGAFYLAKHPTTKALWDDVRHWGLDNGYTDLPAGGGKGADHPVQTVSWWAAVKWCNARSEMEGLDPVYRVGGEVMKTGTTAPEADWSANGWRLPTEAEWEKAARGAVEGKRFPWGTDTISHFEANYSSSIGAYDLGPTNGFHPDHNDGTHPYTSAVGSFAANGYGLFDMAGNVWEWCWDWYAAGTYSEGAVNPRGAASGEERVYRGGAWNFNAPFARSSYRNRYLPGYSVDSLGFRVARNSVP